MSTLAYASSTFFALIRVRSAESSPDVISAYRRVISEFPEV